MRITPHKAAKPRPVALVTPGYRSLLVTTAEGSKVNQGPTRVFEALSRLSRHAVYVTGRLLALRHTTGARQWQASTWRGRATSMTLDGTRTRVMTLRGAVTSPTQFPELMDFVAWCEAHGVAAGSLSQMGWNLWRATLAAPITLASDPTVSRTALYGGRQEAAEPRRYQHMVSWDMQRAYQHAMGELGPYATMLREIAVPERLDPDAAGLAQARITVPRDVEHPPLPSRISDCVIQWQWGGIVGTWPWREVEAARRLGCGVTIERCFAPVKEAAPFEAWNGLMTEGRELDGAAGVIAKICANSLWGSFAMADEQRATVRFQDDLGEHPVCVKRQGRSLPNASTCHVAAETSARVRVRLLEEGLYATTGGIVHVDTDGIILGRNRRHPVEGTEPGQWRVKRVMRMLEVRAPQVYRYKDDCALCWAATHWHYVVSGTPEHDAPRLFEKAMRTRESVLGYDVVLHPAHAAVDRSRMLTEARAQESLMFGPRLDDEGEPC